MKTSCTLDTCPHEDHYILTLPGTCTGDLWHHAAAQILGTMSFKPIVVIALGLISEERDLNDSVQRAPAIHDYFCDAEVGFMTARISLPKGGDKEFGEKMVNISAHRYSHLWLMHGKPPPWTEFFSNRWPTLQAMDSDSESDSTIANQRCPRTRKALHYFLSTTILMKCMPAYLANNGRSSALIGLGERLGGRDITPGSLDGRLDCDVDRKINELISLIASARASASPGFENARVVLFNWRGPSTYPGHASLESHFTQIRECAYRLGLLVIRVAAGVPWHEIQETDFDLFSVRSACGPSIRDKRFTPRFWTRVAKEMSDSVFGLIGGRSGSVDIASFCGLNCFQWDEPVFHIAAAEPGASSRLELPSKEYVDMQVPQFLRLINQRLILSIGLLDIGSYDSKQQVFLRLEEKAVDRWMRGERDIVPAFPDTDIARDLFLRNIPVLEDEGRGLFATFARGWMLGSASK